MPRACCGEQPGPYDASNGIQPGGGGPGGGDVGAVLLSPFIKAGTRSSVAYNHYSMLGSVEDIFGLSRLADAVGTTPFGSDIFTNAPPSTNEVEVSLTRQVKPSGKGARIGSLLANHGYRRSVSAIEAGSLAESWFSTSHALLAHGSHRFTAAGAATLKVTLTRAGASCFAMPGALP